LPVLFHRQRALRLVKSCSMDLVHVGYPARSFRLVSSFQR
jgi:hypothetical protein